MTDEDRYEQRLPSGIRLPVKHRPYTTGEVVAELARQLDTLRRKAAALSEAYTLYVDTDDLDVLADAVASLRSELPDGS